MGQPIRSPAPDTNGARVLVAMSGGVDSSVTAALLLERGLSVEGVTMRLWREGGDGPQPPGEVATAQAVCQQLGIRHHTVDLTERFYALVVEPFVREYASGRTPNPCVRCNRFLKFGLLFQRLDALGMDALATGHYARLIERDGAWGLFAGVDAAKDQSYFLYTLQQKHLRRLLLPLGDLTKDEVRAYARSRGLSVSERAESQDICFVRDGDYRRFIRDIQPEAVQPGPIYDVQGNLLGQHRGLPFYTVGQREGLGISAPRPLYVLALDASRNALVVGFADELGQSELFAHDVTYISGQPLPQGQPISARIRYRARSAAARIWALPDGCAHVVFEEPLRDITPGQAVVFYERGEAQRQVLGGGLISTDPPQPLTEDA